MSLRIGIIGCGGFARYRLGNLLRVKDIEVVALVDPSSEQIALMREQHEPVALARDFARIEDVPAGSLDAVIINTPHSDHCDQICFAFQQGWHVLCEKPLVDTLDEFQAICKARDAAGKIGMVSYQRHFDAMFRTIRQRIRDGHAGRISVLSAFLAQNWKQLTMGSWRQDPSVSRGGMFHDSGSHMVDALLFCSGEVPKTVSGRFDSRGTKVEIDGSISFLTDNGALGTISIAGAAAGWVEEITIVGELESYFVREGKLTIKDEAGRIVPFDLLDGSSPDEAFVHAIVMGGPNDAEFESALGVIKLTEAAYLSHERGGQPVTI
jgi:predicted dehydrogenase